MIIFTTTSTDSPLATTYLSDKTGHYQVRHKPDWVFSKNVIQKSNGEIYWYTLEPLGLLIQYPCGSRQFINGLNRSARLNGCYLTLVRSPSDVFRCRNHQTPGYTAYQPALWTH